MICSRGGEWVIGPDVFQGVHVAEHTTKRRGVVKGIREEWDDKTKACIEIEEPPTAKQMAEHKARKKKGAASDMGSVTVAPHGPSQSVSVPKDVAADFAIGETVEVETTLRHFGKKAEPAKGKED